MKWKFPLPPIFVMQNVESRLNICFDTILNIPKFEEYIKPNFCGRKVSFDVKQQVL